MRITACLKFRNNNLLLTKAELYSLSVCLIVAAPVVDAS